VVDEVMKKKNLRMKEKLLELSKKTPIYVLGGNHRCASPLSSAVFVFSAMALE